LRADIASITQFPGLFEHLRRIVSNSYLMENAECTTFLKYITSLINFL